MLSGTRVSAAKVKQEVHDQKGEAKKSFARARQDFEVQTNTKVPQLSFVYDD